MKQFIDFNAVRAGAIAQHETNRAIIFAVTDYEKEFSAINYGQIDKLLYTGKDIYLVLFPGRPLSKYFNFKNEQETYKQFSFKRVFSNSGYNIYKLL
ncbi:MAG TPA: hypothetical protein VK154_08610 [Chitinophagales bacterium]|nr:hypothetical protein [Chitinophagales bacterium]